MKGKHIPRSELKVGGVYICGDETYKASSCWKNNGEVVPFRIVELYNDANPSEGVKRMATLDGKTESFCRCPDLDHLYEWIEDPWQPKRGERVLVDCNGRKEERIYLAYIEGAKYPHIAVSPYDEQSYAEGTPFETGLWDEVYPLPKKQTFTKAQIAEKLGVAVEELEIID